MYSEKDKNKNLYRKRTYYTLAIEQDVLAKDKEEAEKLLNECGINHSELDEKITEQKGGVETYIVDANYQDAEKIMYLGKVVYDKQNDEIVITDEVTE